MSTLICNEQYIVFNLLELLVKRRPESCRFQSGQKRTYHKVYTDCFEIAKATE